MKKKTGILIIVFSGLSILGVIITQVFWMQNAYNLRKDQFYDKIQVGLKTAVNNLYSIKSSQLIELDIDHLGCKPKVELNNESADFIILDSLLRQELQCIQISKDYVYGIVKGYETGKEMIGGVTEGLNAQIFS